MNRQEALQELQADMRLRQHAIDAKLQELTSEKYRQALELEIWVELKQGIEANPLRQTVNDIDDEINRLKAKRSRLEQAISFIDLMIANT